MKNKKEGSVSTDSCEWLLWAELAEARGMVKEKSPWPLGAHSCARGTGRQIDNDDTV